MVMVYILVKMVISIKEILNKIWLKVKVKWYLKMVNVIKVYGKIIKWMVKVF